MPSVHLTQAPAGELATMRARFYDLLDAAREMPAFVTMFADEYQGDIRADLTAWAEANDRPVYESTMTIGVDGVALVWWERPGDPIDAQTGELEEPVF